MQTDRNPGGQVEVPRTRLTFRAVLRELGGDVANLNFSSVRTFIDLFRRPGAVARDQVLYPHRGTYLRPFSYAFWTSTAYLLVNKLLETPVSSFFDPFYAYQGIWPYAGMLVLLPIAGVQRRLFSKEDFSAAESYGFQLFTFGQVVVYETALLAVGRTVHLDLQPWWAFRIPELIYMAWAATGFYDNRRISVWLRGATLYLLGAALASGLLWLYQAFRFAGWL